MSLVKKSISGGVVMFSNIGKKIKLAAQIMFWLEAISYVTFSAGMVFPAAGFAGLADSAASSGRSAMCPDSKV